MNAFHRTAISLAVFSLPLAAQQPEKPLLTQPATSSASTAEPVTLDVVVTDKSGKPIAGLQPQDFTVLDNNRPVPVISFSAHSTAALPPTDIDTSTEVIIILDEVNTPFSRVVYARQGLQTFLKQNQGQLTHPISLGIFTDDGLQLQTKPSVDGNALAAALEQKGQGFRKVEPGSEFAAGEIFDISQKGLQSLVDQESKKPGKKMVIWLSPGWPLLSSQKSQLTAKQEQLVFSMAIKLSDALRRGRITFYNVDPSGSSFSVQRSGFYQNFTKPLTKSDGAQFGALGLPVLTEQTGGLPIFGSGAILNSLNHCIDDLSAFYTLSIDPVRADRPNEFHNLEIKIATPGLKARTRNGYYAQP